MRLQHKDGLETRQTAFCSIDRSEWYGSTLIVPGAKAAHKSRRRGIRQLQTPCPDPPVQGVCAPLCSAPPVPVTPRQPASPPPPAGAARCRRRGRRSWRGGPPRAWRCSRSRADPAAAAGPARVRGGGGTRDNEATRGRAAGNHAQIRAQSVTGGRVQQCRHAPREGGGARASRRKAARLFQQAQQRVCRQGALMRFVHHHHAAGGGQWQMVWCGCTRACVGVV